MRSWHVGSGINTNPDNPQWQSIVQSIPRRSSRLQKPMRSVCFCVFLLESPMRFRKVIWRFLSNYSVFCRVTHPLRISAVRPLLRTKPGNSNPGHISQPHSQRIIANSFACMNQKNAYLLRRYQLTCAVFTFTKSHDSYTLRDPGRTGIAQLRMLLMQV